MKPTKLVTIQTQDEIAVSSHKVTGILFKVNKQNLYTNNKDSWVKKAVYRYKNIYILTGCQFRKDISPAEMEEDLYEFLAAVKDEYANDLIFSYANYDDDETKDFNTMEFIRLLRCCEDLELIECGEYDNGYSFLVLKTKKGESFINKLNRVVLKEIPLEGEDDGSLCIKYKKINLIFIKFNYENTSMQYSDATEWIKKALELSNGKSVYEFVGYYPNNITSREEATDLIKLFGIIRRTYKDTIIFSQLSFGGNDISNQMKNNLAYALSGLCEFTKFGKGQFYNENDLYVLRNDRGLSLLSSLTKINLN